MTRLVVTSANVHQARQVSSATWRTSVRGTPATWAPAAILTRFPARRSAPAPQATPVPHVTRTSTSAGGWGRPANMEANVSTRQALSAVTVRLDTQDRGARTTLMNATAILASTKALAWTRMASLNVSACPASLVLTANTTSTSAPRTHATTMGSAMIPLTLIPANV